MSIAAELRECSQRVVITDRALGHMARHRQLSWYSREAGGQLFGVVNSSEVVVVTATGPYRGDQRWRTSCRSNASSAQLAVDQQAGEGNLYLGEWHTHPEDEPSASETDIDAMLKLQRASQTRLNSLLLVIQGRAVGGKGIAIYSLGEAGLTRWNVVGCAPGEGDDAD